MTKAIFSASLEDERSERQLKLKDASEPLNRLWDLLTQYSASGIVPAIMQPQTQPPGKRRRGVTDPPPMQVTRDDYALIEIADAERLRELVFDEPNPKGRMGRPPRSYRVPATQWGPAFRLFALVFPDVAATWTKPQAWWSEQPGGDGVAATAPGERVPDREMRLELPDIGAEQRVDGETKNGVQH